MKYEEALRELQEIVDALQDQRISMDVLEERIERAATLIRFCRKKLRTTSEKMDALFQEEE